MSNMLQKNCFFKEKNFKTKIKNEALDPSSAIVAIV